MVGTCVWRARGRWRGFGRDRRGAIALMAALATPVVLMSAALGIEVAHWSAVQIETQRVADMAAIGGGVAWVAYGKASPTPVLTQSPCNSASAPQACVAAVAAAQAAELNGASGTSNQTWSDGSETLSDNAIAVTVVPSNKSFNGDPPTLQVTVNETIPVIFAQLFDAASTETIQATAISEIVTTAGQGQWNGPQPCLVALSKTGNGIAAAYDTSSDSTTGSASITATGCGVRSNADINAGSTTWTTDGIYAAGTVNIPSWASDQSDTGGSITPVANAGTIPDPYASDTALQTAMANASSATGPTITCTGGVPNCGIPSTAGSTYNGSYCTSYGTCTLKPGNYNGFSITSGPYGAGQYTFTLEPGLYVFNGNMSFTGSNIVIDGAGVTIIMANGDTFTGSSSFTMNISAPDTTSAATNGGFAGIAFATESSTTSNYCSQGGTMVMCGSSSVAIDGVVYVPNGTYATSGSTATTGCTEMLAGSVALGVGSYFSGTFSDNNNDCTTLGAASFGSTYTSTTGTSVASLVQ